MNYNEYLKKTHTATQKYEQLGGSGNIEAIEVWKMYIAEINQTQKFWDFTKSVANRVITDHGYKLSKAQRTAFEYLINCMIWVKFGREWVLNHYEYHRNDDKTVNWVFDTYYDKGLYSIRMNTKTLESIAKLGIWEIVKIGGTSSDTIKPNFDFEVIEAI